MKKNLCNTKKQNKQKATNKTKISEQKTIKATIFRAQKLLRGRKLFTLHFFLNLESLPKKINFVLITSFIIRLLWYSISKHYADDIVTYLL